jgi:hypothetical protein
MLGLGGENRAQDQELPKSRPFEFIAGKVSQRVFQGTPRNLETPDCFDQFGTSGMRVKPQSQSRVRVPGECLEFFWPCPGRSQRGTERMAKGMEIAELETIHTLDLVGNAGHGEINP